MDYVRLELKGPPIGSVVHFVIDGAVRRGRVEELRATFNAHRDGCVQVVVRYFDMDGDKRSFCLPVAGCFDSAVSACNEAFGAEPEPEL